jgi:hypothetical protein
MSGLDEMEVEHLGWKRDGAAYLGWRIIDAAYLGWEDGDIIPGLKKDGGEALSEGSLL